MSGIAGIIRFDGGPVELGLVEKMTAAMPYRGPDGINHWVRGSVALGQCMLRTTPESLEENQPLTNDDESLVLVMDGRVDNLEELRTELLARGARLRTCADAELVLSAYESWGKECLAHIDGDFGFVIWDARKKEAFCARDRLGLKPFHYHWDGKAFVFASDLHPILLIPWISQTLNEGMLVEFLADEWLSRNETLWCDIMRLPAAHEMSVGGGGAALKQFWTPDLWAELALRTDDDYFEHYRELFADAVRRHCRSNKPVAFEVSGGLDSSAIFCMAEHLRVSGMLPAPGTEAYTMDFSHHPGADELSYARAVGAHTGRKIHEIPPSCKDISWYAERAKFFRAFPGLPNGVMSIELEQRAAARGASVVISGLGGDEFLQGSRAYYEEEFRQREWANLLDCFAADAKANGLASAAGGLIRSGALPLMPGTIRSVLRRFKGIFGRKAIRGSYWLSQDMLARLNQRRANFQSDSAQKLRRKGQSQLLQTLYHPFESFALEQCERQSSLCGLELRHPFFSRSVVQFAFSTPERLRLRGDRNKFVHSRSLVGILPDIVRTRATKAEFGSTFFEALRPLKSTITDVLPIRRPGWLDRNGVDRLFRSYIDRQDESWQNWVLWAIVACDLIVADEVSDV
jgi:asparagine synthase (glutamine-hydrolysing)